MAQQVAEGSAEVGDRKVFQCPKTSADYSGAVVSPKGGKAEE